MTVPTRIAFCITELDPGGAERAFVRLVCGLDRTRWQAEVYCLSTEGELANPIRAAGIPVTCFGLTSRGFLSGLWRLRRELRRQQPLVLQTFLFHANLLGRLASIGTSVRHVVCGIRVAERRSPWYLKLDRWTDRHVSRHVCVSQSVANFSADAGIPVDKLVVIHNGVDVGLYEQAQRADLSQFGIPADALVILTAGRLDPQKGLQILLDAFEKLAESEPRAHLLIVGEGSQRAEIENRIRVSSIGSRVHLPGRRDDLPSLMKSADLFVLASLWEGMPNVVLEAAASGLPIVATDVEGVAEILGSRSPEGDFNFGWRAVPGDAENLRTSLKTAVNSADFAKKRAAQAQDFVRREFSWDRMISRYDELYTGLLSGSLEV